MDRGAAVKGFGQKSGEGKGNRGSGGDEAEKGRKERKQRKKRKEKKKNKIVFGFFCGFFLKNNTVLCLFYIFFLS